MESSEITMGKKLWFLDLIKESLIIFSRNLNFTIFTFLTSLPLFFFQIINEMLFQRILIQIVKILQETTSLEDIFGYGYTVLDDIGRLMGEDYRKFLLLGLINIVVLHFLDLFSAIATVDIASVIYRGEAINLKDMLNRLVKETRVKGPLITSVCVLLLSSLISLGLICLSIYAYVTSSFGFGMMIYILLLVTLLTKCMEWSAVWNMGIVISILEEKRGDVALVVSAYLSRGRKQRGLLLMLVFFVWNLALRLSCLYVWWKNGGCGFVVTAVYASFICWANVLKWVIFMVYFHDCKKQCSVKKIEEGEVRIVQQ